MRTFAYISVLGTAVLAIACADNLESPFAVSPDHDASTSFSASNNPGPLVVAPDPCTQFTTPECQGIKLNAGGSSWHACTVQMAYGDADHDGVDDGCESEIAKAFAPTLFAHPNDYDLSREPYWAVRISSLGNELEIAYLFAYHEDRDHLGDSEFIFAYVWYDAQFGRWKLARATYSAHYGSWLGYTDRTQTYFHDQLQYLNPLNGQLETNLKRNPVSYVARDKHANYESRSHCNNVQDSCSGNTNMGRFEVVDGRNIGNPVYRLRDCVASVNPSSYPGIECFWDTAWTKFGGWSGGSEGVTPYSTILGNFGWYSFI